MMNAAATAFPAAACREYLCFGLGAEEYGVPLERVQELRAYEPPTRVPDAPRHVLGVINLRGTIVPVVDMRLKLGAGRAEYHERTVMVVLQLRGRTIAIVVDSVSDVVALGADAVRDVPDVGAAVDRRFLTGLGVAGERMLVLLDIEPLLVDCEVLPAE